MSTFSLDASMQVKKYYNFLDPEFFATDVVDTEASIGVARALA